jgi:hypothetical protein
MSPTVIGTRAVGCTASLLVYHSKLVGAKGIIASFGLTLVIQDLLLLLLLLRFWLCVVLCQTLISGKSLESDFCSTTRVWSKHKHLGKAPIFVLGKVEYNPPKAIVASCSSCEGIHALVSGFFCDGRGPNPTLQFMDGILGRRRSRL